MTFSAKLVAKLCLHAETLRVIGTADAEGDADLMDAAAAMITRQHLRIENLVAIAKGGGGTGIDEALRPDYAADPHSFLTSDYCDWCGVHRDEHDTDSPAIPADEEQLVTNQGAMTYAADHPWTYAGQNIPMACAQELQALRSDKRRLVAELRDVLEWASTERKAMREQEKASIRALLASVQT